MTTYDNSSRVGVGSLPAPPFWICVLLGLGMILAGFLVLGDIMLATLISTIFIGWVSIVAGAFEIVHAFWTRGWGGFVWQVLLGVLYIAFGVVLVGLIALVSTAIAKVMTSLCAAIGQGESKRGLREALIFADSSEP